MGDAVNTNIEALNEIRNSLIRFQEKVSPLQFDLSQFFAEMDAQIEDGIKRKMRQIDERRNRGNAEGKTDSFVCDRCGGRIYLRIMGDTTYCRESGCSGTLHRVYRDDGYSHAQRSNDKEELEQMKNAVKSYHAIKEEFLNTFTSFFSSEAGNMDRRVASLSRCIDIMNQYLGVDLSYGEGTKDRTLNASSTNSLERAENGALEVPLMSGLNETFIMMLPEKRRQAVHTGYAHAPDYIVSAINQNCGKLKAMKDTEYQTDSFGHFVLNKYGNRVREACHYSPSEHCIAMHADMTDAEYVDVIQHELGHFIDDVMGRPSTDTVFCQAFAEAASKYDSGTAEGRMHLIDMLDDAFSTGAAYDRNITDIISALTHNDPLVLRYFNEEAVAYYRHPNYYWDRTQADGQSDRMQEKESYANTFAIETGNYRISKNFAERWFPQLAEALKTGLGG